MNGRALGDRAIEVSPSSARVLERAAEILTPFPVFPVLTLLTVSQAKTDHVQGTGLVHLADLATSNVVRHVSDVRTRPRLQGVHNLIHPASCTPFLLRCSQPLCPRICPPHQAKPVNQLVLQQCLEVYPSAPGIGNAGLKAVDTTILQRTCLVSAVVLAALRQP
jgi:hypothetical protein